MLGVPHCLGNQLTDGGEVVSPTHRPRSAPGNIVFLLLVLNLSEVELSARTRKVKYTSHLDPRNGMSSVVAWSTACKPTEPLWCSNIRHYFRIPDDDCRSANMDRLF
jgi:hypothetical protein